MPVLGAPIIDMTGVITLAAVGSSPNANGMTLNGQALNLEPASATQPGVVTTGTQTIAGAKTFSGAISASNLSGTNTGDVTLAAVGAADAKGATISGQAIALGPADGTHPGIVTTGTQTMAGAKTFSGGITVAGTYGVMFGTNIAAGLKGDGTVYLVYNATNIQLTGAPTQVDSLVTATTDSSGTPGDAIINKARGRSAIAATASACVITNSLCAATSGVFVQDESGDATGIRLKVVPGTGSFTVTCMNAGGTPTNATATLKFSWFLVN